MKERARHFRGLVLGTACALAFAPVPAAAARIVAPAAAARGVRLAPAGPGPSLHALPGTARSPSPAGRAAIFIAPASVLAAPAAAPGAESRALAPFAPPRLFAAPAAARPATPASARGTVARRLAGDARVAAILREGVRGELRTLWTSLGALMDGSAARPAAPASAVAARPAGFPRPAAALEAPGREAGAPDFRADPAPARDAVFIGNNWEGTVDVIDPRTFARLARIDVVPDRRERMPRFWSSPKRWLAVRLIRRLIGEGHDQLVDDMFPSQDGRFLYVSRPSLGDAVAIEMAGGRIVWRTPIAGLRADHAAISPDGKTLLISASTARKVQALDTKTGRIVGEFPSGDSPHESGFSHDGRLIYHASIGRVFLPTTSRLLDRLKGDRRFQVVDARTYEVLSRVDMREKLREFGLPWVDSAVRPMAEASDGRYIYLQVSFLHGVVEYDLQEQKVSRVAFLPIGESARGLPRRKYPLNSAHHGIAITPDGTKLVVAGSVSDYAAVVDRETFRYTTIPVGKRPYWATVSPDGRYAYVSVSGDDRVSVISIAEAKEVARVPTGAHPQRVRWGRIRLAEARSAPTEP